MSGGLLERARARNPFPHGTVAAGIGYALSGLTIYAFLAIAARTLGPEAYTPLASLWAITFLAAPGFYYPVEQEVGRALSDRRARGMGGGPVVRLAAAVVAWFVGGLTVVTLAASGLLLDEFFDGQVLLLLGFVAALASYGLAHLVRGTLSGNDRFAPYGRLIGSEGAIRLAGCVVLAVVGVKTAGAYGLVVGLAPLLAVAVALGGQRGILTPGPDASMRELTRAFGWLLLGSVLAQAMINVLPLVVNVLAEEAEEDLVSKVLIALVVARVPVFMFQAVQASLIPQLASQWAAGRHDEFKAGLVKLLVVVVGIAAVSTAVAGLVGPWLVRTFFGAEYELAAGHMAVLAAASGLFMVALALGQAVIALTGYRPAALSWLVGMTVLLLVTTISGDELVRAERGFLAGAAVAAVAMGVVLWERMRSHLSAGAPSP